MSATAAPDGPGTPPADRIQDRKRGRNPVNLVVFLGSLAGILVVAGWAMVAPKQAENVLGLAVGWTAGWFGWFYILLATCVVIFVIGLGFSRYGKVKLGPDHSTPQYTTFSWAAMLFAAGIGTDLMFFSVAEPVAQFLTPPRVQAQSLQAADEAPVWTLFHYGISGWAMYSLMGMALAYFAYRRHQPLAVRSALVPVFGAKRLDGPLGYVVDIAAILGTIFGVATSLGIGVVSLSVGLDMLFGFPEDQAITVQIALVVIAVVMAAVSATTGVDKGIRFLSQLNVLLAIGIALWVLLTGNTQFLLNALVQNIGDFVRLFPQMTASTFAYDQPTDWMAAWTLFFWAWWIAWASFVGLFLARISQGRTIRQFVAGTMILPFSYIVMWVSIFGNSAIERIRNGDTAFGELKPEEGFYTLLQQYPGAGLLIGLATFVGLLFYVTSADSGALVMANLSSRLASPEDDGKPWLRIVWAAATGLLTVAMLLVGGITALQNATVIMGLPFAFVMALVMFGLWRALRTEEYRVQSSHHRIPAATLGADGDRHLARTWRSRLQRQVQAVSTADAQRHLNGVVAPALVEVATELQSMGVPAEVSHLDGGLPAWAELRSAPEEGSPFVYRVEIDQIPVPAFGGRMVRQGDSTSRLEVHTDAGGQGYDVMGYTQAQIIHDVLDQHERHLAFLRLETPL